MERVEGQVSNHLDNADSHLVLERDHIALIGTGRGHTDRRAIERGEKLGAGHLGANFIEQRLEANIDPCGRRGVVMSG